LGDADQMEQEVRLILSKLRELKSLTDTIFYNQLQDVMTLRKQKNAPGLAVLRKELNKALRKHHKKEDKNEREP